MQPVGDRSRTFTAALAGFWLLAVALPLGGSLLLARAFGGWPLAGVLVWFGLLRFARWLSPAARADRLTHKGKYLDALDLCDRALGVSGNVAWTGPRRLVWLNRRTTLLLSVGRTADALTSALEALALHPDPETLGNCAFVLVRLNRYNEGIGAARLAFSVTRERSVISHAALALANLARGLPAEAEALAHAGLEDASALLPFVRPDHYVTCLAALARAARLQCRPPVRHPAEEPARPTRMPADDAAREYDKLERAAHYLHRLQRAAGASPLARAMALVEEADGLCAHFVERDHAYHLLDTATQLAPGYVFWYLTQPGTFADCKDDPRFLQMHAVAVDHMLGMGNTAPDRQMVALALTTAQQTAVARPGRQTSPQAMTMQLVTLTATFLLLTLWAWRFVLPGP